MSVPLLGGEPRLLLQNAAGLSWLDQHHALFSEILTGLHMGLVTATDRRESPRRVYVPKHERGMAHYGYASPDRQSVLIVEMGPTGGLGPVPSRPVRWPHRGLGGRAGRPVHIGRVVARRTMDVLHGGGGRRQPRVARAVPVWRTAADHDVEND